jgi:hypothetical protein
VNYWVVSCNLLAYHQHDDLIGQKEDKKINVDFTMFRKIENGNKIVYIDQENGIVFGLFEIKSSRFSMPEDDPYWSGVEAYKIKRELPKHKTDDYFLSVNSFLVKNPQISFEKFHTRATCVDIDEQTYKSIEEAYSDYTLYKRINAVTGTAGPTGWRVDPDLLAGLLDYYNSRSVSFASLLVASLFGLVTLSAIIQSVFQNATLSLSIVIPLVISLFLYLLFSGAGWYLLKGYSYYTGLADKIKSNAIEIPYFKDLQNIKVYNSDVAVDLAGVLYKEERLHAVSPVKKFISKYVGTWQFNLLLFMAVLGLAILSYWPFIHQMIPFIKGLF